MTGIPPVSANNVVLVAQAPTTEDFSTWAANRSLSGNDAATTADPDGDNLSNLQEYAFNLNPKVGNGSPLASGLEMIGGETWLVIRYRRWSGPLNASLVYQPEWSGGLASWLTSGIIDEFDSEASPVADSEPRRCRVLASDGRKFLRLNLEYP